MTWHLAQLNIGRLRAPTEDPATADFMNNLDRINALAEATPGFVWRLQTDEGNATAIRAFDGDPLMILNLSVWESVDSLADYVYRSDHRAVMVRRREWFAKPEGAYHVLWWVEEEHIPTIEEGLSRLSHLAAHGPTPHAFTFREHFPENAAGPVDLKPEPYCVGWA